MSQQSSQYSFALFLFQYLKSNSPNCLSQISFHFRPEKLAATNINPLVGIFFLNSHHLSPWKVSILLRENTFRSLLRVEGFNNRTELRKKSLFVTFNSSTTKCYLLEFQNHVGRCNILKHTFINLSLDKTVISFYMQYIISTS